MVQVNRLLFRPSGAYVKVEKWKGSQVTVLILW